MVARSLEMRGEREPAQRLIETFLANQGFAACRATSAAARGFSRPTRSAGPVHGARVQHASWLGARAAAEHYLWTRDHSWLAAVSPTARGRG
jgi:hypothetical protein